MTAKAVSRTRRSRRPKQREFSFSQEVIPNLGGNGSGILAQYRSNAWDSFQNLPYPTTRDEPWRRTDLRQLEADTFKLPMGENTKNLAPLPGRLLHPLVGEEHAGQITLVPGDLQVKTNPELKDQGIIFTDLLTAANQYPGYLEKILGKVVKPREGKFSALTASFSQSGVFIYIPKGVQLEQPLHSVFWTPGVGLAHLSNLLIYLEDNASITYVHENASPTENDGQTLVGCNVEIHVGRGANLRFVELQSLGLNVWNFTHERARIEQDGNLDWVFGAIGSRLTKNFSDLDLVGRGSSGRMSGFYFTDGVQHLDHDTQQNHMAPNTTSDLLFKGALKGRSRSVWQGMIYVAEGAQQTDGYQANRNLVLSEKARADSIPGLEILADDVRCTHGATVGKIDPELIFYLRSRGIPISEAERLVVEGFFDPIMQRIPFEGVKIRFQNAIEDKMST
ncbi:MAG: Fe-S cluster assembly protein SufD [Anaerolineales bacterium]|jgi:Fe-S cluster assembly protein SufD